MPQKIWFEGYDGDQTTIVIEEVKFGEPLGLELFDPGRIFPPGTERIDKSDF
jgi:hypothetical protein